MTNGFTKTEQALLAVLSDGRTHTRDELLRVLDKDGLADVCALKMHFTRLRSKLASRGETIIYTVDNRRPAYRQVRNLPSPYDGRT